MNLEDKHLFVTLFSSLSDRKKQRFMSSSTTKKSKDFSTSVFGLKAAIIIVGFILLVAVLSLLYLSTWTIVAKHRYALLTSAFIYPTSTYILLLCSLFTSISIIGLFFMAWVEHRRGLNTVTKRNEMNSNEN